MINNIYGYLIELKPGEAQWMWEMTTSIRELATLLKLV